MSQLQIKCYFNKQNFNSYTKCNVKVLWSVKVISCVCVIEEGNSHDLYVVAVKKLESIVGHMLRTILTLCNLILSRGGSITCTITGIRKYSDDLPQDALEVPCQLTFWK